MARYGTRLLRGMWRWARFAAAKAPLAVIFLAIGVIAAFHAVAQQVPSRNSPYQSDRTRAPNWREVRETADGSADSTSGALPGDSEPWLVDKLERSRGRASSDQSPAVPSHFNALSNGDQIWREYNLAPYTNRLASVPHPEEAVVDWIIRRTGPETWHGEEIAVLSATRGRLRVFHRPDIQQQVAQIVDRFTRPVQGQVSIRVEFAATTDLKWRSNLAHLLRPVAYGLEGQQAWLIAPEDAALIRSRLQLERAANLLSQQVQAKNGQDAGVETGGPVSYISGLALTGGALVSYQPVVGRLHEGIRLTFRPLWLSDGSGVDTIVKLTTRTVQKLHYVEGAAPLSTGRQETVMQVPEVSGTNFEHMLHWPSSQILLISAGMRPTDLTSRRSGFSFGPTAVEVLVLAELVPPYSSRADSRPIAQ